MWWGLLVVIFGAACAGAAAVLQALAARSIPDTGQGLRVGLIIDLVRQWRFLAGIGLDLLSFVASTAALRVLPVFLVQATVSANLVVTALVAWRVLGTHLRWVERSAVLAVCVGLALLGVSAAEQSQEHGSTTLHVGLLAAVVAIAVLGFLGSKLPGRWSAATLGLLAGFAFGLVNLCSRVLPSFTPSVVVTEPTLWAMPFAGICALLFYNTALQRESVVAASAGTIVGQTAFPAAVGLFALGDHTRPGLAPLAIAGFAVSVVGALFLARFGDLSEDVRPTPDDPADGPRVSTPGETAPSPVSPARADGSAATP